MCRACGPLLFDSQQGDAGGKDGTMITTILVDSDGGLVFGGNVSLLLSLVRPLFMLRGVRCNLLRNVSD